MVSPLRRVGGYHPKRLQCLPTGTSKALRTGLRGRACPRPLKKCLVGCRLARLLPGDASVYWGDGSQFA